MEQSTADRQQTWLDRSSDNLRRSRIIPHPGRADPVALGRSIAGWLERKGLRVQVVTGDDSCIVKAAAADGWQKKVGARPSFEVQINPAPSGTEVEIHGGRAGAAVWTARYFTYSWVISGLSFVSMKSALLDFARHELGASASTAAPQILEVVETARDSEPLGGDERIVNNVDSDTTVTRSIKATKRWKQTCNLQVERSRTTSQGADVKLADVAALKSSMENTLREQYTMSAEEEQTFEEHVTLEVPPRSSLRFIMDWKRIVQKGYVRVLDSAGQLVDVPFAVVVGVTFDQRQLDGREGHRP
jgi:hypothetical protein